MEWVGWVCEGELSKQKLVVLVQETWWNYWQVHPSDSPIMIPHDLHLSIQVLPYIVVSDH